jgi:DNA-binding MarR family transcriptional regulator
VVREDHLRLENQLCVALYTASRAVTGAYRPLLDEIGLTYSQYAVMLELWEHDSTTLRDLGDKLHLDSGTLSPLLKRLESLGLVSRSRRADDERVLQVAITDTGRALRERAACAQQTVEAMTGLDHGSLARLRDELNELASRLRAVEAGSAA